MPPSILYNYQTTRHSKHPKAFLEGFKGYLHAGYHGLEKVELVGCIAHARRKFDEALKSLPAHVDKKESTAVERLHFCNQLFKIERQMNGKIEIAPLNSVNNTVLNIVNLY